MAVVVYLNYIKKEPMLLCLCVCLVVWILIGAGNSVFLNSVKSFPSKTGRVKIVYFPTIPLISLCDGAITISGCVVCCC